MRRTRQRGLSPLTVGLIAVVLSVLGLWYGFTKTNPFADPFEVSAAFKTANDIKPKSQVRIAGVTVGKVTEVIPVDSDTELGKRGAGAIVKMEIQDKGLPIHEDARIKIRPRIFLEGNWFVDISPGSPSAAELDEGAMVPVQQTSAPVQFGQLLTALQSDTRQDLQVVLDEYGRALADGGAQGYNRSIRYWPEAFRDSAIVNEATLGLLEHDLSGYIRGADRFARGLDRDPRALKSLLTDLATTADAFASEERNLSAAVAELPRTLSAGRAALGALNEAFPPLRRLVADLRPAVRSSGPALDATLPLVRELRGLVSAAELRGLAADLRPVVPDLAELNKGGVGLQQEFRQLSSCSNEVVVPWRNDKIDDPNFPASGPVLEEQVKWLPGIAAESRSFDANGQWVRSLANGANYAYPLNDGRLFVTGLPLEGVNPPKADAPPPLRADVPCETQQPPDLRTRVQPAPRAVRVNHDTPAAVAARAKAKAEAIELLEKTIKGTGQKLKVSDKDLTAGQLGQLSRGMPAK